jgi:coiled-coil domain-containing protein 77
VAWAPTSTDQLLRALQSTTTHRQLELRRQLDVDGWAADVTALRKTLAVVDRKLLQMRLIDR